MPHEEVVCPLLNRQIMKPCGIKLDAV
jgi:hypothetical protein